MIFGIEFNHTFIVLTLNYFLFFVFLYGLF
jgi:hypothetical protein